MSWLLRVFVAAPAPLAHLYGSCPALVARLRLRALASQPRTAWLWIAGLDQRASL